jgi:hypothetical protein
MNFDDVEDEGEKSEKIASEDTFLRMLTTFVVKINELRGENNCTAQTLHNIAINEGSANLYVKIQIINVLGFVDYMVLYYIFFVVLNKSFKKIENHS